MIYYIPEISSFFNVSTYLKNFHKLFIQIMERFHLKYKPDI